MDESTRVEQSKFSVGAETPAIDAGDLPWAYGEDRITTMVRDPESAFLYWEITDDGIDAARARLGPAGHHAWCNLRVYDTTGREFDGTNANDYFDIRVDRHDREYFVMIRRPTSTMHAEIGMKSHEGFFQAIARSGPAVFPRTGPSPDTRLDWMTVTGDAAPPCVAPYRSRYPGPEPPLPSRAGAGYVDVWRAGHAPPEARRELEHASREHRPWSGTTTHRTFSHQGTARIERWWRLEDRHAGWQQGLRFFRWEHFDPRRVLVELLGEQPERVVVEGGEMIAYGPWRVTVHGFEEESGRRVLSTWSMRWVQATTPMIERWEHVLEREVLSEYEASETGPVAVGASEQHGLLERGASELWRLGGSERMWMGASEWSAAGGSETLWLGASALLYRGGSEHLGGSERLGASEWLGASGSGGASGRLVPDSGERWGGR